MGAGNCSPTVKSQVPRALHELTVSGYLRRVCSDWGAALSLKVVQR